MIDDETLLAYLDGELDPARASVVAAAIASDPALARKAEQHKRLKEKLRHAFGSLLYTPVAAAPIPASAQVIDFRPSRQRKPVVFTRQHFIALAAVLILGLIGGYALRPPARRPIRIDDGRPIASPYLARALDSRLSGETEDGVRIKSSFRNEHDSVCRAFAGTAFSGVACREDSQWRIMGLFPASGSLQDQQATALAAALSAGKPLDQTQEKAARDQGGR